MSQKKSSTRNEYDDSFDYNKMKKGFKGIRAKSPRPKPPPPRKAYFNGEIPQKKKNGDGDSDDDDEEEVKMEKAIPAKKPMQELRESIGRDKGYYLGGEDLLDDLLLQGSDAVERDRRALQPPSPRPKQKKGQYWKVTKWLTDREMSIFEALPDEVTIQIVDIMFADAKASRKQKPLKKKKTEQTAHDPMQPLRSFSETCRKACEMATPYVFHGLTLRDTYPYGTDWKESIKLLLEPRILSNIRTICVRTTCHDCGWSKELRNKRAIWSPPRRFLDAISGIIASCRDQLTEISFVYKCKCEPHGNPDTENGIGLLFQLLSKLELPKCERLKVTITQVKTSALLGWREIGEENDTDAEGDVEGDAPSESIMDEPVRIFKRNMQKMQYKDLCIFMDDPTSDEERMLTYMLNTTSHLRLTNLFKDVEPTLFHLDQESGHWECISSLEVDGCCVSSGGLITFVTTCPNLSTLRITNSSIEYQDSWSPVFQILSTRKWEELKIDNLKSRREAFENTHYRYFTISEGMVQADQKEMNEMFIKVKQEGEKELGERDCLYEVFVYWSQRTKEEMTRSKLAGPGHGGIFKILPVQKSEL